MAVSFDRNSILEKAFRIALAEYQKIGALESMPTPMRTMLAVYNAQGIIDNGGMQYFFENDWAGQPSYSVFVEAYGNIGANEEASALAAAVELFPFPDPQKHQERRREFLEQFLDGGSHRKDSPFNPYTDKVCGSERVFELLQEYVEKHPKEFSS
jgi:hypothetical protein